MFGEMSKQQSTKAKIDTQGGVDSAVATDVAEATLKAAKQQGATQGELAQNLMAANPSMSKSAANELAKAMTEGGDKASSKIAEALGKGIDINGAISSAGALASTMAAGKTAGELSTVKKGEEYKDGGYVGLQKNSATIKAAKQLGDTTGQMDIPDEARTKTLENIMDKAILDGRGEATKKDLMRAGLMNEDGTYNPQNWVQGIAHLGANNMQGQNAIVAGGATYSGALGANPSIQMNALNSTTSGSKTVSEQGTRSMANMYNALEDTKDKIKIKPSGEADIAHSSPEAQKGFARFVQDSGLAKSTKDDILQNTAAKISKMTGATPEEVWAGMGLTGGYLVQKGLGDPVKKTVSAIRGKSNKISETKNQANNHSTNNQDGDSEKKTGQHVKTPEENYKLAQENVTKARSSLEDYTEKLEQEQGKKNPNPKKVAQYKEGIGTAENEMRANKQLAAESLEKIKTQTPLSKATGKALKFAGNVGELAGRGFAGFDAVSSGVDAFHEFKDGETLSGLISSSQSIAAAAFMAKPGPVTGAMYTVATAANMGQDLTKSVLEYQDRSVVDKDETFLPSWMTSISPAGGKGAVPGSSGYHPDSKPEQVPAGDYTGNIGGNIQSVGSYNPFSVPSHSQPISLQDIVAASTPAVNIDSNAIAASMSQVPNNVGTAESVFQSVSSLPTFDGQAISVGNNDDGYTALAQVTKSERMGLQMEKLKKSQNESALYDYTQANQTLKGLDKIHDAISRGNDDMPDE